MVDDPKTTSPTENLVEDDLHQKEIVRVNSSQIFAIILSQKHFEIPGKGSSLASW